MKLTAPRFYSTHELVDRFLASHNIKRIPETGREITRPKGAYTHRGIVLGRNRITNEVMIVHNHPRTDVAIVSLRFFENNNRHCLTDDPGYNKDEVMLRAINEYRKQKSYHPTAYNCQHYTNYALTGEYRSQGVNNTALLLFGMWAFSRMTSGSGRG